jgi:hypothetical protein
VAVGEDYEGVPCARCAARIDPHEDRYVIGYRQPMERLEWIYLCAGCVERLREWLLDYER